MSSLTSTLAALLIPGIISLVLYYSITQVILPFLRRHQLTSEYLPLPSFPQTSSWHERIPKGLISSMVPKAWLRSLQRRRVVDASMADDTTTDVEEEEEEEEDVVFGDEEGENMVGVSVDVSRRKILERSDVTDVHQRLSRDLEEGFRDDSDEES